MNDSCLAARLEPCPSCLERRAALVRLLETRDDGLPVDRVRRDHPPSGFNHDIDIPVTCPDCLTNDRVIPGCESCGGTGKVIEHRDRDPYAVSEIRPYGLDPTRRDSEHERDRTIERLARETGSVALSEADALADANANPARWELERRRMYARFDYRPLDLALDALRVADESAYHVLHSVFVYRSWVELSVTVEGIVDRGLRFLEARMPEPIRAPGFATGWARRRARS